MISERRLYQKNGTGYLLLLFFIATTALHSVFTLNAMDTTQTLGIFVMSTILLLLMGFLAAVKVRVYSTGWSWGAMVLGLFQIARISFIESSLEGYGALAVNAILVVSGVFGIAGSVVSLMNSRLRRNSLEAAELPA